jgi:hypothetical protein
MALALPLLRLTAGAQARRRARLHRRIPEVPVTAPGRGPSRAFCGPQIRARSTDPDRTATRRHAMQALRYPTGAIIAAASTAPPGC